MDDISERLARDRTSLLSLSLRNPLLNHKPRARSLEVVGESPEPGASTTTGVPILTRLNRSIASSLVRRMQPDEIADPMYSG